MTELTPGEVTELLDWKRRVFALYAGVRATPDPEEAWSRWRQERDDLFAHHPQSPIPAQRRAQFEGLPYWPYDRSARVAAVVEPARAQRYDIATSDNCTMSFTRFARARLELGGRALALELYWLDDYAGGLFVPCRDATSGSSSYGGGRYLLDTVKGADLGVSGDRLVLDFNFAYNPSCAYDARWVCPLAPPANRLDIAIEAGERAS